MTKNATTAAARATALAGVVAALLGGCGGGGCDCADEAPAPPDGGAAAPGLPGPIGVANGAAFDLVATGDGAALVYSAPEPQGGGIHVLALDARGAARGPAGVVHRDASGVTAPAIELAAVAHGSQLGVVWIHDHEGVRARGAVGDARGQAFGPPVDWDLAAPPPVGERGSLTLAVDGGGAMTAMFRGTVGECLPGEPRLCTRFYRRTLGTPHERSPRGIETMVIEDPCPRLLVGSVWSGGDWFYGVCEHHGGLPQTTVYALRPSPMYAEPFADLTPGCDPQGLVALPDRAALYVARCAGGRLAAGRLGIEPYDSRPFPRVGAAPSVECADSRPVLHMRADGLDVRLAPSVPVSRLEPMLPPELAPPGARAVWTGEALLVAFPRDTGSVALRRHTCVGRDLR